MAISGSYSQFRSQIAHDGPVTFVASTPTGSFLISGENLYFVSDIIQTNEASNTVFTYDASGRIISSSNGRNKTVYSYDVNGNLSKATVT